MPLLPCLPLLAGYVSYIQGIAFTRLCRYAKDTVKPYHLRPFRTIVLQELTRLHPGIDAEKFLHWMHEYKYVMTGSFVLQCLFQESWKAGDIDLLFPCASWHYRYTDFKGLDETAWASANPDALTAFAFRHYLEHVLPHYRHRRRVGTVSHMCERIQTYRERGFHIDTDVKFDPEFQRQAARFLHMYQENKAAYYRATDYDDDDLDWWQFQFDVEGDNMYDKENRGEWRQRSKRKEKAKRDRTQFRQSRRAGSPNKSTNNLDRPFWPR
jgi:hypothetical protein